MDSKQGGEDSTAKASILAVNQLTYQLAPDLSVAVSRTLVRQYPMGSQKVTSRDTLVFVLHSGSAYVDLKYSYLSFDVSNTSGRIGFFWHQRRQRLFFFLEADNFVSIWSSY